MSRLQTPALPRRDDLPEQAVRAELATILALRDKLREYYASAPHHAVVISIP